MSRPVKTIPVPADDGFNPDRLEAAGQAAQQLAVMTATTDDALECGRDLGRLEMAAFMETVSAAAKLSTYENIAKTGRYKNLINRETGNCFRSIEEFCDAQLGVSARRMRQIDGNRKLLGQELFEQSERLGLGQRDYSAIKSLPAADQALIKQAVEEASSRDEVLDILHELASRHAQEKANLTQQVEDSQARIEAKDKVAADTQKTIQRLQEEIHGKKPPSAEFLAEAALRDIDRHATDIVVLLEAELRRTFVAAQDHEASTGAALLKQAMEAAVGRVLAATKHLIEDFDIHTAELVPAASQEDAEDQAIWAAVHNAAGTGQSHVAGK